MNSIEKHNVILINDKKSNKINNINDYEFIIAINNTEIRTIMSHKEWEIIHNVIIRATGGEIK